MVPLSSSLIAHQRGRSRLPALRVTASATRGGHAILRWQQHHAGSEPDDPHAAVITGDGALIRARNASGALYVERIANPSPASTFGNWANRGACDPGTGVALAARGGETLLACVDGGAMILRSSADGGATWSAPTTVVSGAATWLALAFAPSGDACLFYSAGAALYRLRRTGGAWAATGTAWTNSADSLTGVAAVHHDGDWHLLVTGTEAGTGHRRVWGVIMGDGNLPANAWSWLKVVAASDALSGTTFAAPSLAAIGGRPRGAFSARESGPVAADRAVLTHPAGAGGATAEWSEPVPQGAVTAQGLALTVDATRAWACTAAGVWSAPLPGAADDLSPRVTRARLAIGPDAARCRVEVVLGDGGLAAHPGLIAGGALTIAPGYRSGSGGAPAYGAKCGFIISRVTTSTRGGRRLAIIEGHGLWEELRAFVPPQTWQVMAGVATRGALHQRIAGRAGFGAASVVPAASPSWTTEKPAFVLGAGESAASALTRLMTAGAELVRHDSAETSIVRGYDPDEAAVDAFGPDGHPVLRFEPVDASRETTVVRLLGEGRYADAVNAEQAARAGLRQRVVRAPWAATDALVSEGAANALAQAGFDGAQHRLAIPAHAGVQLWDVITVSDAAARLDGERFRVTGVALHFDRERGRYEHDLTLGRP